MNDQLYLSRARLRRDAPASALRALLLPTGDSARVASGHRLVWTLFGDTPDRVRDFLWRETDPGEFYLLSARMPHDEHNLFSLDEPKEFAPVLAAGQRLGFALRANATVARGTEQGRRGKPCDVVMDALHNRPKEERAAARAEVIESAGTSWLVNQGTRRGFTLVGEPRVLGYRTLNLGRSSGSSARIGVLDFEGTLEVTDPGGFLEALSQGFGRAKAFGCGLMLIRRA